MVVEYALLTVAEGEIERLRAAVPEATSILLSSPGCTAVEFEQSLEPRNVFLMKVVWDRIEDHTEGFANSDLAPRLGALIGSLFVVPPSVAHFAR